MNLITYISTVILILLLREAHAQRGIITMKYAIHSSELNELNIQKLGLRTVFEVDPDFSIGLGKYKNGKVDLGIQSNGLYRIADAIKGHIIYLEAGDSVSIALTEIPNLKKLLKNNNREFRYFNNLTAKGKYYWHYIFFDKLFSLTENLYPFTIPLILKNTRRFNINCDKALLIGQKLIDSLFKQGLVSANFKEVAMQEINAIYVSWMCTPLYFINKFKIGNQYFVKLNKLTFNDSIYAVQCSDYIQAGALYTYYIHNDFNPKKVYSNLATELTSIQKNYSGIIKDKLMAWQIEDYIGQNYPSFDSCYQIFLTECKTSRLKNEVTKKVNAYVKPNKNLRNISLKNLLSRTKVQSQSNESYSLLSLCDDTTITLIDCWATWCGPCKNQMPYIHTFEKKYKSQLKIVYLSFDKDEDKWKSFLSKNKLLLNQYLMNNDFNSDFSHFFEIQSIPRYILFSKQGIKVLNTNMPLPILENEFEHELLKYINQQ